MAPSIQRKVIYKKHWNLFFIFRVRPGLARFFYFYTRPFLTVYKYLYIYTLLKVILGLSSCRVSPFSRGVIFTRVRFSLALLSLMKNGGYS